MIFPFLNKDGSDILIFISMNKHCLSEPDKRGTYYHFQMCNAPLAQNDFKMLSIKANRSKDLCSSP